MTAFQMAKESDLTEIMQLFPISIMTTQCSSSTVDIKKEQPFLSYHSKMETSFQINSLHIKREILQTLEEEEEEQQFKKQRLDDMISSSSTAIASGSTTESASTDADDDEDADSDDDKDEEDDNSDDEEDEDEYKEVMPSHEATPLSLFCCGGVSPVVCCSSSHSSNSCCPIEEESTFLIEEADAVLLFDDLTPYQIIKLLLYLGLGRHREEIERNADYLVGDMLDRIETLEDYEVFLFENFPDATISDYLVQVSYQKFMKMKHITRKLPDEVSKGVIFETLTTAKQVMQLLESIGVPKITSIMQLHGQHVRGHYLCRIDSEEDYSKFLTHIQCALSRDDLAFHATFQEFMKIKTTNRLPFPLTCKDNKCVL